MGLYLYDGKVCREVLLTPSSILVLDDYNVR